MECTIKGVTMKNRLYSKRKATVNRRSSKKPVKRYTGKNIKRLYASLVVFSD